MKAWAWAVGLLVVGCNFRRTAPYDADPLLADRRPLIGEAAPSPVPSPRTEPLPPPTPLKHIAPPPPSRAIERLAIGPLTSMD